MPENDLICVEFGTLREAGFEPGIGLTAPRFAEWLRRANKTGSRAIAG